MAALFDRSKKKTSAVDAAGKASVGETSAKDTKKTAKKDVAVPTVSLQKSQVFTLLRPHVSEKAAVAAEKGIYVFDVPVTANKVEIAKAVESFYKVNVAKVRTIRGIGKAVRRGVVRGRRNRWKKALVELKKGQTINLVEGV